MCYVYYWENNFLGLSKNTTPGSIGHMSLRLSDGTYISHYPGKDGIFKKGGLQHSFDYDISELGKKYKPVKLPSGLVDEDKIRTWWIVYKETANYNLVSNNCAQVVVRALKEGGIKDSVKLRFKNGTLVNLTPLNVYDWLIACALEFRGSQTRVCSFV